MNAEQLWRALLRGPMRTKTSEETNPWAGRTTVQSGSAFVTVSTSNVRSGDLIFVSAEIGSANVAAASGGAIMVDSIVDNTSFALARQFGVAVAWDDIVVWQITKTR